MFVRGEGECKVEGDGGREGLIAGGICLRRTGTRRETRRHASLTRSLMKFVTHLCPGEPVLALAISKPAETSYLISRSFTPSLEFTRPIFYFHGSDLSAIIVCQTATPRQCCLLEDRVLDYIDCSRNHYSISYRDGEWCEMGPLTA